MTSKEEIMKIEELLENATPRLKYIERYALTIYLNSIKSNGR